MMTSQLSACRAAPSGSTPFDSQRDALFLAAQQDLDQGLAAVQALHDAGASGRAVVQKLTTLFDQLCLELYNAATGDMDASSVAGCALIAIGGYGRGEMNPRSDLDLMFYYERSSRETANKIADRMLYLLWDLKLDVGSCVRSGDECLTESADITVKTALLDARLLAGSESVFSAFSAGVKQKLLQKQPQKFIDAKLEEHRTRKEKYGSSVYLLEPNLKEGEGGLRELHNALWIARVRFRAASLRELLIKGMISEQEFSDYELAHDYLWRIRNHLHFYSPRKNDQLTFDLQQQLAAFLGYVDSRHGTAVELFMRDYYAQANEVEHLATSLIIRATQTSSRPPRGPFSKIVRRQLEEGFYIIHGELRAKEDRRLLASPELMMVVFELAQRHEVTICNDLKQLIRENLHLINDKVRRSRRMVESFRTILRQRKNIGRVLRKMHHLKFLNAFIPEFKHIYCKVQFDLYHIYTVDIHTIFAVEVMEKLWAGAYAEEQPLLTGVANNIEKPELLLLAILFHDIGKGSGKDHSIRGAEMVPTIARRLHLNQEDSARLQFLVRHHLQMTHISQRRDLQDMKMIAQFAELMGMSENLRMLYLLTFADLQAVGPDIWTEWKGNLLRELYEKTFDTLEKKDFYREQRSEKARNRKRNVRLALAGEFSQKKINRAVASLTTRYLLSYRSWEIAAHLRLALARGSKTLALGIEQNPAGEHTQVTLATLDCPGLFSFIAGVLAAHNINILGAQIHTRKSGEILDILQVNSATGTPVADPDKWARVEQDLAAAIEGRLDVAELVAKRQPPDILSGRRLQAQRPNKVLFDNDVSENYTVIDIFAHDHVGLLYNITRALSQLGLSIAISKIATKVDQVADVFYVKDIFGQKVTDPQLIEKVRNTILESLE
jgi:[protein-PII] uridylyltransferase